MPIEKLQVRSRRAVASRFGERRRRTRRRKFETERERERESKRLRMGLASPTCIGEYGIEKRCPSPSSSTRASPRSLSWRRRGLRVERAGSRERGARRGGKRAPVHCRRSWCVVGAAASKSVRLAQRGFFQPVSRLGRPRFPRLGSGKTCALSPSAPASTIWRRRIGRELRAPVASIFFSPGLPLSHKKNATLTRPRRDNHSRHNKQTTNRSSASPRPTSSASRRAASTPSRPSRTRPRRSSA